MKNILFGLWSLLFVSTAYADDVTYYINDALGSPIAAMNENGNLLWRESYSPYGESLKNPVQNADDVGFTGHQKDDSTGLTYMQSRYYDPVVGRFYGIDPIPFRESNIQSFGAYTYANNNPYRYIDPDGRNPIYIVIIIFVAKEGAGEGFELLTGYPAPTVKNGGKTLAKQAKKILDKILKDNKKPKGANNPKTKKAAEVGREKHKEFADKVKKKDGWESEKTIEGADGKKLRPDAITPSGRPVELKPNTPSGKKQGAKQLKKYEEATGKKGRVVYYDPET